MIEEAWGKDVFAKGRLAGDEEESANDEDARELTPRLRRPWPMLGISAIRPGEAKEWMKPDLGVIDEGSDHDGEFEMRDDGEHASGEFQMDGEEMLKEIKDLVACSECMSSPHLRTVLFFLSFPVDEGQGRCAMACPLSMLATAGDPCDTVLNGKYFIFLPLLCHT
jgi:hypothetical protein